MLEGKLSECELKSAAALYALRQALRALGAAPVVRCDYGIWRPSTDRRQLHIDLTSEDDIPRTMRRLAKRIAGETMTPVFWLLELPMGALHTQRVTCDTLSMRLIWAYDITSPPRLLMRVDVLFDVRVTESIDA